MSIQIFTIMKQMMNQVRGNQFNYCWNTIPHRQEPSVLSPIPLLL